MLPAVSAVLRFLSAVALAVLLAGCGAGTSTTGTGDPEDTVAPTIASAEPAVATPNQRLNVRVRGTGFDPAAVVSLERGGVPEPGILVHSTTYVSPVEVVADITVGADAPLAVFDVGVRIPRKKGTTIEKGTKKEGFLVGLPLTLAGAFVTTWPQPVKTWLGPADVAKFTHQFFIANPGNLTGTTNFAATHAAGIGQCSASPTNLTEEAKAALFMRLRETTPTSGTFYASVDLINLDTGTWGEHGVMRNYAVDGWVQYGWAVGRTPGVFYPDEYPTVNKLASNAYQYTGGRVSITQGPWRQFYGYVTPIAQVSCPNLDTVVVVYPADETPISVGRR